MDSRQRFLNTLKGLPIDRFFRYDHGPWPSTRERWLKEGYPADAEFGTYFDMDPMIRFAINSGYCDSPYHPKFEQETLSEDDDYILYRDGDGIIKRVLKTQADTSMPQFVQYPVKSRQDWPKILERLDPADALERIGDPAPLIQQCADPTVPTMLPICGAFGHPRNLLGDEGLSYILYDDPLLLHEILDNWCELYIALLAKLTSFVRVDSLLVWEDMCYKGGPLISPAHFRTFMLPRYKRLFEAARGYGVEGIIVDSDGDVLQMIPLFVEGGADCIMPFEVQAGMDVVQIRERFGRTFCIKGGIDKRALAVDKASIRAEVERVVPYFVRSGHYIPTLDHTVPINVPLENYRYYLQVLREYDAVGGIP